jgi:hypothetical protein
MAGPASTPGENHYHPAIGSVLLYKGATPILFHDGFTTDKRTSNHSIMLFGPQYGEGKTYRAPLGVTVTGNTINLEKAYQMSGLTYSRTLNDRGFTDRFNKTGIFQLKVRGTITKNPLRVTSQGVVLTINVSAPYTYTYNGDTLSLNVQPGIVEVSW